MAGLNIIVVIGSLRRDSFNKKFAAALPALAPSIAFTTAEIGDLPLYNQDDDAHQATSVKRLKEEISRADGVIFVTPEYNRSIPGVLKNAIDHASRPYGDSAFAGKPVTIAGLSTGAIGTACAQQHLRNIVNYLDMPLMGQPEMYLQAKQGFFDESGAIGAGSRDFVAGWLQKFADFVRAHQSG